MDKELFQKTIAGKKATLVDFFATWCGPCKTMHPVLETIDHEMGDHVYVVKLDIDQHEELASEYKVMSVPTLILFREGKVLWRESGAMPAARLKEFLSDALKK